MIFNSITQFIQSPDRTKRRAKRDDLDTLSEVWTGPAGSEDGFMPVIGTRHLDYNLMRLINVESKRLPALVAEITLYYQGKLDNSNTGAYTSVPTISRYWQEGEISYQDGYYTWSHRYTGRCVTISFITNQIPSGNETNLGLAKEFLGFTNEWKQLVTVNPGGGFASSEKPIKKMTCSDVRIEDRGDGWFQVVETYQSRMFPGTVTNSIGGGPIAPPLPQQNGPFITIGQPVQDWYATVPNLFGQDQNHARTSGTAKTVAQTSGQTLSNSPAPPPAGSTDVVSQGTEVATTTSLDPAWGATEHATAAASASVGSADMGPEMGSVSQLLDF